MNTEGLKEWGWNPSLQNDLDSIDLDLQPARVISLRRQSLECQGLTGSHRILFQDHRFPFNEIAIGDWLGLDVDTLKPLALLPRTNELVRRASGTSNKPQCLAANLDGILIVVAADSGFNESRIERCLVLATQCQVPSRVVLTKVDLCLDTESFIGRLGSIPMDTSPIRINASDMRSCSVLSSLVASGETWVLLGTSGVGKSTLVNTLCGDERQRTQNVREKDSKGRHTTVSRSLTGIPGGGILIDGPGLREFGFWNAENHVNQVFADVNNLSRKCKFTSCSHTHEPGCQIREAVGKGKLTQRRVDNYKKILAEVALSVY